jgi:peptidoglycan/LPS O-acetylase OafA/YrhL
LASLDGLRGLAALVVVAHHALLTVPSISAAFFGQPTESRLARVLTFTPLHIGWAGTEAVYVFFVLSGLVLVRAMDRDGAAWDTYVPSRLLRLIGPVLPAALFAWVLFAAVPRDADGLSMWLDNSVRTYGPTGILRDLTLVGGISGAITPLWSMRWELYFSLLLPVFVLAARRLNYALLLVASLVVSFAGVSGGGDAAKYLSMFALGAALASAVPRLGSARLRLDGAPRAMVWFGGLVALIGAGLLVVAGWWHPGLTDSVRTSGIIHVLTLVGIVAIVVLSLVWTPWVRVLESRALQWTGVVSFSLYLVHEPIIKTAAFAFPGSRLAVVLAVLASLGIAWAFARWIERPIHLAARRVAHSESLTTSSTSAQGG